MAGAINGLGAQQLATSLQPASQARGDANEVRQRQDNENEETQAVEQGEVAEQARGAASEVQETAAENDDNQTSEFERQIQQIEAAGDAEETERGSLVDITV